MAVTGLLPARQEDLMVVSLGFHTPLHPAVIIVPRLQDAPEDREVGRFWLYCPYWSSRKNFLFFVSAQFSKVSHYHVDNIFVKWLS